MRSFRLTHDDERAIAMASDAARRILQCRSLTPQEIIGLGNALYALERMPAATPGVWCEFGLVLRVTDPDFSEMRYIDFRVHETEFEICQGGSTYSMEIGSDSYTEPGWVIDIQDNRRTENCDLFAIESTIEAFFEEDAHVNVTDASSLSMLDAVVLPVSAVK